MSFKQNIEKLIKSNLKVYQDNPDRFIADYNREQELTKEYNGRQLLELLQNADDASSKEVLIVWDKINTKLIISNKGNPFEIGGIKSLMLANLSTKTKISYIGNKGLGFRSILNWAERINISSNNCNILFSEIIAKNVFDNCLKLSENDKRELKKERDLSDQAVPFPVLAIPVINEAVSLSNWTTAIEIIYRKEFEADIESQLAEIREEILLFLHNIQKITIQNGVDTHEIYSEKETVENYDLITIKEKKWFVFTRENILPEEYQDKNRNERQSYNLKVAFQDDLSDNYQKLFNFFPTQLSISLPCIIHGTFELNSSRNHLNESKKNEYIIKELVQLLKYCALYFTEQNVDWRPYKLINPLSINSDSKLIAAFYKNLEELRQTEKIYPCINNEYNIFENAIYYNDKFNGFFQKHFSKIMPELLMPLNNEVANNFMGNIYKHDSLVEKIDALSQTEIDILFRSELIAQLAGVITFDDEQERFSLLVNEVNKVIPKDDLTFTPVVRSEETLKIPESVNVDFINQELYDSLVLRFENGFDKKEPKSRELQRCIKSVVNLQPYDSNNVIEKIITGTKDILRRLTGINEKVNSIREMVTALYVNYRSIENRQEKIKITIPLVSRANTICYAEDLYLGGSYPSGNLTEVIYEDMLQPEDYLAPMDFWMFNDSDSSYIEGFFLWLGVNKHSKITFLNLQNNWSQKEYIDFIFANGNSRPEDFDISKIQKESIVSKIERFDDIRELPLNKIILLALKDPSIKRLLNENDERISWRYNFIRTITTSYSYLRFQFLKSDIFTKYILEEGGEDLNKLINKDFQIDYQFLAQYGINKTEVKSILIKLGAKESFNDISPKNVYEILKTIPEKDIDKKGKATQTIYKMALESLVKQNSTFPIPEDIQYFSRKADLEDYQPRTTVYYADNSILPKKILNTLSILNLPKRIGEDNVEKYFGVKSLREFKIQINEQSLQYNPCNSALNTLFESLKPYLLAYRLESPNLKKKITDVETKRKEARTLKHCTIHIVTECIFSLGDNGQTPIDEKEFINVKDTFYFKESSLSTVDSLKKDSLFCDAFAEMICIIFRVNDLKNDFRQILKNDIQDTIHLANQDLNREKLEEAFHLLGVSRVEIDFWKKVFALKNEQLTEPIENSTVLRQKIHSKLGLTLPEGYARMDFESFGNRESYELICLLCKGGGLSVRQILPDGLYIWHKQGFIECIKDCEYKFKQLIWEVLKNKSNEQGNFITILNNYNLEFIIQLESVIFQHKFYIEVDYLSIIKENIKEQFSIDIDNPILYNFEARNQYKDLLTEYNIEETDITNESIRSLLFFEGNTQKIENHLIECFSPKETESNNIEVKIKGTLVDASLSKNGKTIQLPSNNGNGGWIHSGLGDKTKKRKGKKAELLVYNTLVEKFGIENVKWVSGNSTTPDKNDKLHYDIEYKNEAGEWKYLEVKAIQDNRFVISGPEKDKGIAEPDKYEMALVNETTIYMIKNIFKFKQGETFENNSNFVSCAKDYIFFFDVNSLFDN